jgi:hypothetical protein
MLIHFFDVTERQQGAPKEKKKKKKGKQGSGNNTETARSDTNSTDTKTTENTPAEKYEKLGATANGVASAHDKNTCSLCKSNLPCKLHSM